jgi:hypothetical protein
MRRNRVTVASLARIAGVDVSTLWVNIRLLLPLAYQQSEPERGQRNTRFQLDPE